ncbi:SBP-type domain-containing protein [Psidium guajava]|nr:SBP-type domain-containing protein [Psidium guajava]
MERANLKYSWTILLMLVLAFGLASLPATKARELVTEDRTGVEEEGKATGFHYRILPRSTPIPPAGPSCRHNCGVAFWILSKGTYVPPSSPSLRHNQDTAIP